MMSKIRNLWLVVGTLLFPYAAFGAEGEAAASAGWATPLAAGLGIALAVVAAATAQSKIASAYLEGASRNPGAQKVLFTPLILGLAFVETLVLFTILIEMMVLGKV